MTCVQALHMHMCLHGSKSTFFSRTMHTTHSMSGRVMSELGRCFEVSCEGCVHWTVWLDVCVSAPSCKARLVRSSSSCTSGASFSIACNSACPTWASKNKPQVLLLSNRAYMPSPTFRRVHGHLLQSNAYNTFHNIARAGTFLKH